MDNNQKQLLAELARKCIDGTATPAEQEELHQWYDQWEDDEEEVLADGQTIERLQQTIFNRIKEQMQQGNAPFAKVIPLYNRSWFRFTATAAAIILVVILGFLFLPASKKSSPVVKNTPGAKKIEVTPGRDKAILKLADGSVIELDSVSNGLLALQGNTSIVSHEGKIVYDSKNTVSGEPLYNTISTPRGGKYQLVLPDGTRVWLNASSSIKFPVTFEKNNRTVELNGEAYFEVAKDASKPFIAKVKDIEVQVLGTHFNIMSYEDEGQIATTLLEGAVKVSKAGQVHLMKPGQQAVWKQDGQFVIDDNVDMDEVIAWKNGRFHFNNVDIQTIMRQVSRWYDVDVLYVGEPSNVKLGGIISRKEDVSQLLKFFEVAGKIQFKVEGKKIIVTR